MLFATARQRQCHHQGMLHRSRDRGEMRRAEIDRSFEINLREVSNTEEAGAERKDRILVVGG